VPNYQSQPVAKLLSRLKNVQEKPDGNWMASCPCRDDDHNPSLSITVGAEDQAVVHCHRGLCDAKKIFESCGLDLARDGFARNQETFTPPKTETKKIKRKLVKVYDYLDEDGVLLFQKLRYQLEDGGKSFSHRRPNPDVPGDWIFNLKDTRKVLYRLPQLLEAIKNNEEVWLVEGEKDADTMCNEFGVAATTMTNGANSWAPEYTLTLAAASLVNIIADNDEVGKQHSIYVRDAIRAAGGNANVWVSKHKKDITDHVQAGYSIDENDMLELLTYDGEQAKGQEDKANEIEDNSNEYESNDDLPEERKETQLLSQIENIISLDSLTLEQKIGRINFIANSFSTTSFDDYGRTVNWQEFLLEAEDDSYEWVIPGLLEKQERVIVVAAEGVGKTMLARQVAISCAAGLHPFTFQPMKPVTTLTIDLENPARIIRRTSRTIMENAIRLSRAKTVDAHLHIHPSGLDLTSTKDRIFLEQLVEKIKPELICLGPLYKAYVDSGNLTSEALAVEVAKFLDHIRDAYGCALWLEHHAPLGASSTTRELRPFGSSVWSRWPEFGISITPDPLNPEGFVYDVRHFRGARDKREWPIKMKRSLRMPFEVIEFMKE